MNTRYRDPHGPIWINAGEASGDMHGALLARALREQAPDVELVGMGGPDMERSGVRVEYPMQLISLVGIVEVLGGLPRIIGLLGKLKKRLMQLRPRAIVLLDCPDFNFRLIRIARKLGIPVYYYISPQVWAWRSYRANFLRDNVQRVMCILPFEQDFYKRYHMDADYVGHPLLDQIPLQELDAMQPDPQRIGLLPGSRSKEISTLLPEFAAACMELKKAHPGLTFTLMKAPGVEESYLRRFLPEGFEPDFAEPDQRYHAMRSCRFLLAASGTVTLEAALLKVPTIVAYKLSPLSFWIGQKVVNVEYCSLPNLIAGRELFPELLQEDADARVLLERAREWMDDAELDSVRDGLKELRHMVGEPGAPKRAAAIILNDLNHKNG